ncbi:MAG: DUF4926 domain-containing protein [Anaerolineae bacterium]|nr:DUF4926 domain-containing protein [Anaerolineae bacterium]
MIEELDMVALTVDLPEYNLRTHDVGAVVLVHGDHDGYEVEFVTITGETVAIVSVFPTQIRRIEANEIAQARKYQPA